MKPVIILAVIIVGIIGSIAVFASISPDTWQDQRTDFTGVAPPDEIDEKIDCLSNGGTWDYTSCEFEYADESFEESFESPIDTPTTSPTLNCSGDAQCFTGIVSDIIDGDTIKVNGEAIRFALSSAPELKGYGGADSRDFIETLCPVGSSVLIDEDDAQILGSYGRIIAKVTCNDVILNSELLDANLGYLEMQFCDSSEFRNEVWAQKHGCKAITDLDR